MFRNKITSVTVYDCYCYYTIPISMLHSLSSSDWLSCNPTIVDRTIGPVAALKVDNSLLDAVEPTFRELRFARRELQYSEQRGKSNTRYIAVSGKQRYWEAT
jgi:hypothetical protein